MGLGVIREEVQVQFALTRIIYMWRNLRCTFFSRSPSLSPVSEFACCFAPFWQTRQQCFGRPPVCPSITTTVQGGMSGDGRRASRRFAWEGLARSLPASLRASRCSRAVPGRLGAGRARAVLKCGTWADDRWTPTQLAMANFRRKTACWFHSESRNNEGKRTVYSNRAKEMVKVLDFVQSGGPECTVDGTVFELWLGAL